MTTSELKKLDRSHVIYSWKVQGKVDPTIIDRAEGIYMWDTDGKQHIDFCSGLINVNIGHSNKYVLDAMKKQMEKLTYVAPEFGTEAKAKLASMVAEVTPGDLDYVFFTNAGAEAIENAIKTARWFTGRHKVYSSWRGYHGATSGAITLTGDPRRWPAEPGIPGVVKYFTPYPYNCPFGSKDEEDCGKKTLEVLKTQVMLDNPKNIAAIFLEPIIGTNGIIIPPKNFVQGLRQLCDENGILLVADETMGGWGRSGKWFSIEHYGVIPDIMTTAKGITSGYVPLGAMIVNKKIWDYLQNVPFVTGLTYCGHALACAAGVANIEVYKNEKLIEKSAENGEYLHKLLLGLKEKHSSIGDVRCKGLWACLEFTSDRKTKAPLADFADRRQNISAALGKKFTELGLWIFAKWDYAFLAPPLIITREQLDDAVSRIDKALEITDKLVK